MGQPGAAKGKRNHKNNLKIKKSFRSKRRTKDTDLIRDECESQLFTIVFALRRHHPQWGPPTRCP